MIKNITYENKEAIQNNPDLPKKNMVTDEDMNEIKNVVNNNADELNTTKENVENLQEGQGTANTDITNLKSRVSTLETDNTKNKSDIENLQNDNETNQSNIGKLQQKTEQIEKNISDIQQEQTTQNKEIEKLQTEVKELNEDIKANAIIEETEKTKSLYIDDANASRGKVNVFGNMEQEIREGYNLIDILNSTLINTNKSVEIEIDKDGYVIANGTPTADYIVFIRKSIDNLIEDKQTYSLWQEKYSTVDNGGVYSQILVESKEGSSGSQQFIQASTKKVTFVVDKSNYNYTWTLQIGLRSVAGTFNNYKNRYMLYKGTDNKEFELYGASPSLDYPSAIKSLGSNINLYPGWEKNTISSETGKPEIEPNYIRSVDFISVLPNKNYTIKAYNIKEFGDLNTAVRMYDINKNYLSSKWIGSIISNSLTFTLTNADVRYIKIVCSNNNTVTNTAKVDIKLEEGEVATTYSPFEQGSTEIRHFNTNFLNTENTNKIISGVKIESNTDKSLKITGTATADGYESIYNKITLPFVLKQGTKVYLNFGKDKQLLKDTKVTPFAWFYSEDSTNTGNINKSGSYVATVSKDTTMLTFGIENIVNAKVYDENMYIVLSTENVEEYVENKNDSYILNIQQEMLKGDYFDLETKEEVHCNGKAILNGTEAWTKSGTVSTEDFPMFYTNRGNIVSSGEVKSNALKYVKDYQTQDTYVTSVGEAINIRIATEIIGGNTVELFKTFLQNRYNEEKAIEVYYKRSTPARIPLTADQIEVLEKLSKLRFYNGVNNILTTEDIALLQAKYSVNIQSKINSLINAKISELNQPELLNK